MNIPVEHQLKCKGCGEILDMRDLGQVLSHGWIEDGKIVCYPEVDIPHTGCKKIGSHVEYLKKFNDAVTLN